MSTLAQLFGVHLAATAVMTGLIWFVQIVHYPLFARVDAGSFTAYARHHVRRTGWVVVPLMLIEAGTAVALVVTSAAAWRPALWLNAALLAVIWLSTFLLQVPCHRRLEAGFEAGVHRRLVRTNWIRTGFWTVRLGLLLALAGGAGLPGS